MLASLDNQTEASQRELTQLTLDVLKKKPDEPRSHKDDDRGIKIEVP